MNVDCDEIIPARLWVGGYLRPEDVKQLARNLISTVVSLQTDDDLATLGIQIQKLLKAYQETRIELRRIPIPDFDKNSLAANLPLCVAELQEALQPEWTRVYLHCTAGINRSPTIAAAYLIRSRDMSAAEAYDYITARRHCSPYLDVLEQYAESLKIQS